ncbi:MAG: hypothetical protein QGF53_06765 [Alphaproteobacteria bacterium]|nr:hypothetical protein [Alphaproteobacteria bacterium]
MRPARIIVIALLGAAFAIAPAAAGEFRAYQTIPTPAIAPLDTGETLPGVVPVDHGKVEAAVEQVFKAYSDLNPGKLESVLAESFFDRSRVVDNAGDNIPRDAKLEVLGIRSIQTLSQSIEVGDDGRRRRVSVVSATVSSQLEFNNSGGTLTRLEGTSEYLLRISEPAQ